MIDLEVPVFVASIVLTLKAWLTWYRDIVLVNHLQVKIQRRLVLLLAPLLCLAFLFAILKKLAAVDVRDDPLYLAFYLLVGAAWVGGSTLVFPFLGISARDDALERGNSASVRAIVGALAGISCSFAGGNIGNGPGVQAVLFSAVLSSGLFFALWLGLDLLTSISDSITVDRAKGAGLRLGGFLIGVGLLSGWSVAGDWVSASATLKEFVLSSWPAMVLTAVAAVVELAFRRISVLSSVRAIPSVCISAAYVGSGLAWVATRGVHS